MLDKERSCQAQSRQHSFWRLASSHLTYRAASCYKTSIVLHSQADYVDSRTMSSQKEKRGRQT